MEPYWQAEFNRLVASLKDEKEARDFLKEILSPAEYKEIARRWQIVKLLLEGETQRRVRDILSISVATVTRGSRELKYGSGILKKMYQRLYPKGA